MEKQSKICILGYKGMVGSAIFRNLKNNGYSNFLLLDKDEMDLGRQDQVEKIFNKEKPDYIFFAAAKVGGIHANNTYKAEFIYDNIIIAANVINSSYKNNVKKLINLGSSCIYPKFANQPIKEEYLLTGELEPTNEPYAIAKISAIKLCRYFNEQYNTNYISVMPTNLYGENDNFDLMNSHVMPALIRKIYLAKLLNEKQYEKISQDLKYWSKGDILIKESNAEDIIHYLKSYNIAENSVEIWGSGEPYREFLYVDDLAEACVYLMKNYEVKDIGELINIGSGKDIKVKELAMLISEIIEFKGKLIFNKSKPDGTPRKLLDVSKINTLGWKAKISLKDGIIKTFDWYKRQSNQ
jgi:GDP-L-fucose synthase